MKLAGPGELRVRAEDQHAEAVAVVHHVEERCARVGPGRRQHLKESAVRQICRVGVARNDLLDFIANIDIYYLF